MAYRLVNCLAKATRRDRRSQRGEVPDRVRQALGSNPAELEMPTALDDNRLSVCRRFPQSITIIDLQSGVRVPSEVRKSISWNRLNLEPALILALTKIRPRIEALACQKQAHLSHQQDRRTLIADNIFNHTILLC
jgi:hypothetical protein